MSTNVQEPATTDAETPQRNIAIKSIKLTNLLSFGPDSEPLELGPLNVLIGANGSGKSNFIETLALLRAAAQGKYEEYIDEEGGADDWLWKGGSSSKAAIELIVSLDDDAADKQEFRYYTPFIRGQSGSLIMGDPVFERIITPGQLGSDRYSTEHSEYSVIMADLKKFKEPVDHWLSSIVIYRDWDFGRKSDARKPRYNPRNFDYLEEDASNLSVVLKNLLTTSRPFAASIAKYLKSIYEDAHSVDVRIVPQGVQLIMNEDEYFISVNRLSNGTLQWLALLTVLLHPIPPPLICLEEPELGLHPDIIPTLAKLLREASERTQLIVTTHSRDLVDAFTNTPDVVAVCEKEAGATKMRRLPNRDELTAWLDKFSLGEMWSMNLLGGNRY
ncbi:MAG: chromosome segregation protein SMC [Candidatus Chloroheliales bacterium]|nr:MAG: chromosome segregation protein SMC [Chloroflexota bacterium]